ncbi:hypothetical protein [Rheinheimera sp. MMS21-TC3]|uniref:lysozyme inhibitor LprI family protein n=1 Tax=Rheinheimera sp. MMS21-TC3 TaxID=3072790 RepID=UPI0028C41FCC|nr:hypothetical protein [Rheinheimera sp. MMS21-TC3]WNO61037.1 hypothetical protein RDV63_08760 [Rheinheimera sp. MMS21-TC3]
MKFNWKVAVSIVVLISGVAAAAVAYWQVSSEQKQRRVDVINLNKFMSELNCTKPANQAEAIICSDDTLQLLDRQLAVAYHNNSLNTFWQFNHAIEKRADAPCIKDCLVSMDKLQQRWISKVRNRCSNVECLTKVYIERIAELNGQPEPLPTFRVDLNRDTEMCHAMLEVLNQTPRDQLGACTRYDFSGSPFSQVSTKLTSEHWQNAEQFLHQKNLLRDGKNIRPFGAFADAWPELNNQYQAGARKLYGVKQGGGEDEEVPWLLEVRYTGASCQTLPYGTRKERSQIFSKIKDELKKGGVAAEVSHAERHGWESVVAAPDAGQSGSVYSGQLLRYKQEWFVLDQSRMSVINGPESHSLSKSFVYIKKIYPDMNVRTSRDHGYMCSYWYNY